MSIKFRYKIEYFNSEKHGKQALSMNDWANLPIRNPKIVETLANFQLYVTFVTSGE